MSQVASESGGRLRAEDGQRADPCHVTRSPWRTPRPSQAVRSGLEQPLFSIVLSVGGAYGLRGRHGDEPRGTRSGAGQRRPSCTGARGGAGKPPSGPW